MRNSTFSDNVANRGSNPSGAGAIATFPSCTGEITGSTFVNNSTIGQAKGGAILNDGALAVSNSTFAGNHADTHGGAISIEQGSMTLTNVTVSGNSTNGEGAGIYVNKDQNNTGTLNLRNSIVANNNGGLNCGGTGTLNNDGNNLRYPASDTSCVGAFGDPKLATLANNGGPTQTMALQTGSAAIQLAAANCPSTDQRGFVRPLLGGKCDAGAYELGGLLFYRLPVILKNP